MMTLTLILTEGELAYLAHTLIDGHIDYDEMDGISCYQKILDLSSTTPHRKTKPKAAAVWEALKGVVG
jgi:hypothetical protein